MQIAAPVPLRRLPFGQTRAVALLAGLVGVAVVAGSGFVVFQRFVASAPAAPAGQIVPVERGTVAATVSATGSVVATRQAKLVFATSGRIKDILVSIGDHVTAGQPLARLVADSAQVKLDTARSQLATAQIKLRQVTEGATAEDVAAAQAAYDAAVAKLTDLQAGPTQADLASVTSGLAQAQATYAEATAKLRTLQTGATEADRATAIAAVQSAQNAFDAAQAKLDQVLAGPTVADVTAARAAVDQALASVRSAEAKLDQLIAGSAQADLAAAQAGFDQAQANLTTARAKLDLARATQPVPADVAQAQSTLVAVESKLHVAHQNLDKLSDQLAAAYANLGAQQSALQSARQSANAICDKLGGSSADCASANSRVDGIQPQILQIQQQIRQMSGNGSWEQLAAHKDVVAAQAAYDAAAANLKQVAAARSVGVDLITAQSNYDAALSQLTSARAKLDQTRAGATTAELVAAQSGVEQARAGLASAQAKLDQTLAGATNADLVAAQTAADTAAGNVAAARTKLETLGVASPQDLQAAQATVASASLAVQTSQAKLDQLKAGPTQTDFETARSAIASAQASLADKSGGNAKQSDIALQQEAVRQAELAVQQAQIDLDNNTLLAPFDGVVAVISGNPGETAPTGTTGFLTLVDPREVRVDVTVDETDLAKLQLGQSASIRFDALPNQAYVGKVIAIAPNSTVTQGVVTYPVSLSIEPARGQGSEARGQGSDARPGQGQNRAQQRQQQDPPQTEAILPPAGLTAAVTVTVARQEDVLTVPLRAIRRQGRAQVVEVVGEDGKTTPRPVRVGVQNDQVAEIIDGLADGDQILVPTTTTRALNVPGGPGPVPGSGQNFIQFRR